jgi:ABC-type branched-subunit amino acid transport system ATPase component
VRDTPVGVLPLATQKKTEIARAVATGPKVLLLDEMMNGLTREETASLVGLVRELNAGGLTVVLVEHIIPVIRALCGRLIVVDHGKLIATGTPAECLADPVVVEAYIGTAAKPPARNGDSAGGVASQESKEEA